jgi:hypothetical protein
MLRLQDLVGFSACTRAFAACERRVVEERVPTIEQWHRVRLETAEKFQLLAVELVDGQDSLIT